MVFVMLCAQLVLAQHATVHFIEDEHIGIAYAHESDRESPVDHSADDKDKACQICLFAKILADALPSAGMVLVAPDFAAASAVPVPRDASARDVTLPIQARAPPSLPS